MFGSLPVPGTLSAQEDTTDKIAADLSCFLLWHSSKTLFFPVVKTSLLRPLPGPHLPNSIS